MSMRNALLSPLAHLLNKPIQTDKEKILKPTVKISSFSFEHGPGKITDREAYLVSKKIFSYVMVSVLGTLSTTALAHDGLHPEIRVHLPSNAHEIGNEADAGGMSALAVGPSAKSRGSHSTALGGDAQANNNTTTAVGGESKSDAYGAVAVGFKSHSSGPYSTTLGYHAKSKTQHSIALGSHSTADKDYNAAERERIKKEMPAALQEKINFSELSLGGVLSKHPLEDYQAKYSQITHVAPGTEDTDAVNLYQTKNIVRRAVEKLQSNDIEAHVETIKQLRNEVSNATKAVHAQTKQAEDAAALIKNYKNIANTILTQLKNDALDPIKIVNHDNNRVINIGNNLQETVLAVSGRQGNRVIRGVTEGVNDNDASNMRQLHQVQSIADSAHSIAQRNAAYMSSLEHQLSSTNTKLHRGLAASAALNGLFQPYTIGKVNITAAVGGYGSSQALALGSGYRLNENTAVKAGISYSGGGNAMYNASFNLEW